jgi:hypothetical protein
MKKQVPRIVSNTVVLKSLTVALGLVVTAVGMAGMASAQTPPAAPAAPIPPAEPAPVAPMVAAPVAATAPTTTNDHDAVVGLWGIGARQLGTFKRTQGEDPDCGTPCLTSLNALSVRKWLSSRYAYSLGLAVGVGGGSRRNNGDTETFDTYFGVGPTVGASFLLASFKHISVSLAPQLDLVYFLPSGKGSKSFMVNLRGLVEGEVHLGMIGLPTASIGLQTGLLASFLTASEDTKTVTPNALASRWSLSVTGPTSLWDLVTNATLRYYF